MKSRLDLSQFEVIKKVGEGGFGQVFEIKNKKTSQIYAAKVALNSLEKESKETIQSLSREVNIIARLNHPTIVKFIGYSPVNFKNKPKPVIVTEFLSNGSLGDILNLERKGLCKTEWTDTKKIINIYGIAAAMSYLHSHNIIHRDLKPDNILMDDFLCPKMTDFGLSKIKHTNDESMTLQSVANLKGTPLYIAPEIWASYEYTQASDVYAYGFIVFEIMTCEEPFKNSDVFNLMTDIINGVRPEIINVPDAYKELIENCWDQNPSNRPTFDQIIDQLKNNSDFITDLIESEDYYDYIDYIEKCKVSFNNDSYIQIDQFVKRKTKTFKKITIDKKLLDQLKEEEDDDDDDYSSTETQSDKMPDVALNKKQLPFELPPDDPSVSKYREFLYKKINGLPKDDVARHLYAYAALTHLGKLIPKNYKESAIFYKIAADLGNVEAMWHFACNLCKGEGTEVDFKEADRYFEMAIEKGSVSAMYTYAAFLEERNDSSLNEKILHYYKMAADKDDKSSMHNLGVIYSQGKITKLDYKKALKYFKMAAKKGEKMSMICIAIMYEKGEGVEVSKEKALNYYKLAAQNGSDEAMNTVGNWYEKGIGTEANIKKAIKYYLQAEEKGNTNAMVNLGRLYLEDKGVEKNNKKGIEYFEKAAELQNTKAMINLSLLYIQGEIVPYDKKKSFSLLQKAIDLGDTFAMRVMGIRYKEGTGVEVDHKKEFKYYKMAADAGSLDDLFLVGLYTMGGVGTEKNPQKAVKYYKKGVAADNTLCIIGLAEALYTGEGIKKNEEEAIKYFNISAKRGNTVAQRKLGEIYLEKDANSAKGIELLKMAAAGGEVDAYPKLALILQTGENRSIDDYEDSLKYAKMAYVNGRPEGVTYVYNLLDQQKIKAESVKDSILFMKQAADGGDTNAMFLYSKLIFKIIKENPSLVDEAYAYLKLAADNGVVEAMYTYGMYSRIGIGGKANIEEARKYLKMAADQGHEKALANYNELNNSYMNKNGEIDTEFASASETAFSNLNNGVIDINASMRFLKLNADRGNVTSMLGYASFIDQGALGPVNHAESAHYYKMAADAGNADGQYNYGIKLALGQGVQRDHKQASRYLKMAADQGHEEALAYYNQIKQNGGNNGNFSREEENTTITTRGKENNNDSDSDNDSDNDNDNEHNRGIDISRDLAPLKAGADSGDINTILLYAKLLEERKLGKPNYAESARYYKMGADLGDANCQYDYGVRLALGQGVLRDYRQACQYFRMAISKDHPSALSAYGVMYEKGLGVTMDKQEAFKYYQKALEKGSLLGIINIATMLFYGDYLNRNLSESARYFKLAADEGNENISRVNYGYMLKIGLGVIKNYEQSCRYFRLAADEGDVNAMIELAKLLEERKNIGNNQEEARRYYQMSTDKDNINETLQYQKTRFIRYIAPVKYCVENIKKNRNDEEDESLSSLSESDFENNTMDKIVLPKSANKNFMGGLCKCSFCSCMTFIFIAFIAAVVIVVIYITMM